MLVAIFKKVQITGMTVSQHCRTGASANIFEARFLPLTIILLGFLLTGCTSLPDNRDRIVSYSFTDTQNTALGSAFNTKRNEEAGQSGFLLLNNGLDAFVARAAFARGAERGIDAQYYLLHDDLTGRLFINELVKAAERGVRVRLLVDDMDLDGRDSFMTALDALPNFEVRIFNPFSRSTWRTPQFVTRFGDVTRRMHNKSFTVDAQVTVLGGRNIGDEYFEANPAIAFGDLDVLGIGPVARDVSQSFDAYWNHPLAYPVLTLAEQAPDADAIAQFKSELQAFGTAQADSDYITALRESRLAKSLQAADLTLNWGRAEVVADNPDKLISDRDQTKLHLTEALGPYFLNLAQELTIFSPYFVPGEEGVDFFSTLVNQGVQVRILTNSLASTDVGVVHAGYARYRRALLRAGVELYEMNRQTPREQNNIKKNLTGSSRASLHAKSFVLDRQHVFIGSLNLDPRSVVENSEVGVVIEAPQVAESMAQWFDKNIQQVAFKVSLETTENGSEQLRWTGQEDGKLVVYNVEPHTSIWQRIGINLMRLLPIESQL